MARTNVFILTGFLGAGKTSFINRLAKAGRLTNSAVVVNEFGEAGLDGPFLAAAAGSALVEMTGGCLCCALQGELSETLLKLPEGLDRVIIETSGLADPQPMMRTLVVDPDVAARFAYGGVVTLVDMKNFMALAQEFREIRSQVAFADRIVLTKLDAIGNDQIDETIRQVKQALKALNHHAPILNLDEAGEVFEAALSPKHTLATAQRSERFHAEAPAISTLIEHDKPIAESAVRLFADILASAHGDALLRLKGLVDVGKPGPLEIHAVAGVFSPFMQHDAWPPKLGPQGVERTRIVTILRGMDGAFLHRLFASCTDMPMPDTADRKALEDNPLAVPGHRF